MPLRRNKSLSIVLLGLALFLFTISLQKAQLRNDNSNKDDGTGSVDSLEGTRNVSFVPKASKLLKELNPKDDSHDIKSREKQSDGETLQVISLRNPVKVALSRARHNKQEKTTASREFLNIKKVEAGGELRKRFPTAIILGVKKAGTRALLDILRMHPNVKGASNEVYFFNGYHSKGLEWYRQQMPVSSPGQITIEKSPTYFTSVDNTQILNRMSIFSRSMPERLKLIAVVRDPVKRCVSEYTDLVARSQKDEIPAVDDFETLVLDNNGSVNAESELIKTGLYKEHLKKWLEYFLKSEIHFVSGEELAKDPLKEIKSVEKFLELKPFFTEGNFRFNEAKGFPCLLPDPSVNKLYCLPPNKGRKHVSIKQTTLELLRRFYRPYNEQFYATVKRNFNWSSELQGRV